MAEYVALMDWSTKLLLLLYVEIMKAEVGSLVYGFVNIDDTVMYNRELEGSEDCRNDGIVTNEVLAE